MAKRILMVDDNTDNTLIYTSLFKKDSIEFVFLSKTDDFFNYLADDRLKSFDIVILDYNLDNQLNGIDLLKKLRSCGFQMPVIIFSATSSSELSTYNFNDFLPVFSLDKIDFSGKRLVSFCNSLLYIQNK